MVLLLPALLAVATQSDTPRVELRRVLQASVRIEVIESRYLSIAAQVVPSGDPAAPLVNGQPRIFEYLLQNGLSPLRAFAGVDPHLGDTARTSRFIQNLLADSAVSEALGAYYDWLGSSSMSVERTVPKPVVAESRVLTIASRFFYPARIIGDRVQVRRCAGINGIAALGTERDLLVEAFAFATILNAVDDTSGVQLNRDFDAAHLAVQRYAHDVTDTSLALDAARREMYGAMMRSEGLRSLLRRAYARLQPGLPFRIREWEE